MGFEDPFLINLAFNGVMMVGCAIGLLLIDSKYGGRRRQMLWVTAVFGPMLGLAGAATGWGWNQTFQLILIMASGLVWQMAWGMMGFLYPSEIFTNAERDRANSLAQFAQWAFAAVNSAVTACLLSRFGASATLIFYACYNLTNFVWIWVCIRETKGVPLEQAPALFEPSVSTGKNGKIAETAGAVSA